MNKAGHSKLKLRWEVMGRVLLMVLREVLGRLEGCWEVFGEEPKTNLRNKIGDSEGGSNDLDN